MGKLYQLSDIVDLREVGRLVHCHGDFDRLSIGSVRFLQAARRLGNALVVTITPDLIDGQHVYGAGIRAELVAALECVTFAVVSGWPEAAEAIKFLRPHVHAVETGKCSAEDRLAIETVGGRLEVVT
jgi:bifunctional ADP-heptose synthase (sugar kinase/adenylyltransferase)